jgi:Pyruvate/2-oxoacid:ferredoxin oxidoreductase delta subunit
VIVVSKAKTHMLTYLSGAAKNLFGVIPGFEKPAYHAKMPSPDDFSGMIADLNDQVRPALQIMDAVTGMEGDGPHTGTPRKIGAIMASGDWNAIDVVTARLMAIDPMQVGTIRTAVNRGLLQEDMSDLEVVGDEPGPLVVKDYQHPSTYTGMSGGIRRSGIRGMIINLMFSLLRQYTPWPRIDRKKCIACMKCVRSCPKETIFVQEKRPVITYSNCIRCYCCHEMCDSHAISLERNLPGKVIALLAGRK